LQEIWLLDSIEIFDLKVLAVSIKKNEKKQKKRLKKKHMTIHTKYMDTIKTQI
jgi:hypothetical protein